MAARDWASNPGGFSMFINDPALREYGTESALAQRARREVVLVGWKFTANMTAFYYAT